MTLWDQGPEVRLVASTSIGRAGRKAMDLATNDVWDWEGAGDAADLSEFAGRTCYLSYRNTAGRTNEEYLREQIISHEHYSVLEHATATFYVSQVSRSLLTELTRHRQLSFSVQSQRYVDESAAMMIVPPDIAALNDTEIIAELMSADTVERARYVRLVDRLQVVHGYSRKQARSAARAVLPNMTATTFVVTGNHRAWREVLGKRLSPQADTEIRNLAKKILGELYNIAPAIYQDIVDDLNSHQGE